jgi:hypothetical protein
MTASSTISRTVFFDSTTRMFDQWCDELHDRRGFEIEILNVNLGRMHTRPGARGTTTVCVSLLTAHDLHAVRENILRSSRSSP